MATRARGSAPQLTTPSWWTRMWSPFWAVPVACAVAALALAVLLPLVDRRLTEYLPVFFHGGPDGARSVLTTIATAMISVTGLVFSITMVVLQLASSQFTPRVLGSFLDSRVTQVTLGVFVATFVFALTVLRSVVGDSVPGSQRYVPTLSVSTAFVLVLASVGMFLAFIHHITTSIQVTTVVSRLADATVDLVDQHFPQDESSRSAIPPTWSPGPQDERATLPVVDRYGYVVAIDFDRLIRAATAAGVVLVLERGLGDYLVEGQPLATAWRAPGQQPDGAQQDEADLDLASQVSGAFLVGGQPSMRQDVTFGVRQLVDIAERALSPGINDPTTAVQVLNELHRVLRIVVTRDPTSAYVSDDDAVVRVVHRQPTSGDLVRLSTEEIAHWGRDSVQIPRRLIELFDDLQAAASERNSSELARVRSQVLEIVGQR